MAENYDKAKLLGQGAFGKAYLAKDKRSGRYVVLKEVALSRMTEKEKDSSKKEVLVLAQMKHVNIVQYINSFEASGNLVIVMDFCDDGDLHRKIASQKGKLFSENKVIHWFVQICLAMKHIHDRKILHRDIKSQNIFLMKTGILKLGDFGIARVLNSTIELATTITGTPYYLSPEICEAKPYNNKSDIWSIGCVLYEMLSLKHPFLGKSLPELSKNIKSGKYLPISHDFSKEIRQLVAQLLIVNPRERLGANAILKLPFISAKISKFLNDMEVQEEFSHTVIHSKPKKSLPNDDQTFAPKAPKNTRPPSARRSRLRSEICDANFKARAKEHGKIPLEIKEKKSDEKKFKEKGDGLKNGENHKPISARPVYKGQNLLAGYNLPPRKKSAAFEMDYYERLRQIRFQNLKNKIQIGPRIPLKANNNQPIPRKLSNKDNEKPQWNFDNKIIDDMKNLELEISEEKRKENKKGWPSQHGTALDVLNKANVLSIQPEVVKVKKKKKKSGSKSKKASKKKKVPTATLR